MKIFKALLIMLIAGTSLLGARIHDQAGEYGFQFLNISADPINLALGGRGVQASLNHSSFIIQPATGSINSHRSLGASYMAWLDDTSLNSVTYGYSDRLSHFGISLRNLDYGSIENRDDTGALIGYYHPTDLSMMANYARRLGPTLYLGANGGVIYEKLSTASSYGVHADLGLSFLPPFKNSLLSFSVRNLGIASKMNQERVPLPVSFEMDLGKRWEFDQGAMILEYGAAKALDSGIRSVISTQVEVLDRLSLRGAYKFGADAQNLSAGIGININSLDLNYGWAHFDSGLDDVHSFGICWRF